MIRPKFLIFVCLTLNAIHTDGYHYSKFYGPVSGAATEFEIDRDFRRQLPHSKTFDYFAKPDYVFAYGVEDPKSGNYQNQKESRKGDVVSGEYSVVEADGSVRRVVYTADSKNGFRATVHVTKPDKYRPESRQNFFEDPSENSASDYE